MLLRVVTSTVILATLASACGESSRADSAGPTYDAGSSTDASIIDGSGSADDTTGGFDAMTPADSSPSDAGRLDVADGTSASDAGSSDRGPDGSAFDGSVAAPPALKWRHEGPTSEALGIWGSGPDNVYVVGSDGLLTHSTGDGRWMGEDGGTTARLTGVWGSGAGDIYVSVRSNAILHSTGNGVWDHHVFQSGLTFGGMWGSGPADVYAFEAGAEHTKGDGMWSGQVIDPDGQPILAMWGSSATDVYAGAALGTIYHSVGNAIWIPQKPADTAAFEGIGGSSATDVYAITYKQIFHSNGDGTWKVQPLALATLESLHCVWALGKTAVYIGSEGKLYRSGGGGVWLDQVIDPQDPTMSINAVWGTSATNLYVATTFGVYHGTP